MPNDIKPTEKTTTQLDKTPKQPSMFEKGLAEGLNIEPDKPQQPNYKRGLFRGPLNESFIGYHDKNNPDNVHFTKNVLDKMYNKYYKKDFPNNMKYNKENDSYIFNQYANDRKKETDYPDSEYGDEFKGEDIKVGDKTIRAYPFLAGWKQWNGEDLSDEQINKNYYNIENRINNSKLSEEKKKEYFNRFNELKNRDIEDYKQEDIDSLLDNLSADEPYNPDEESDKIARKALGLKDNEYIGQDEYGNKIIKKR